MSGFEVAGVVLGSIPIVVSALELYIKGLGTMGRLRRFTLELESLVLKLGTEEAKLQNVYEKLLRDIVPDDQIEPMLKDPFGPLWKEPNVVARIRRRLWRDLNVFNENVRRMNAAMSEMKEKLGIGPDGKVRWVETSGMKKQFKRVMFILKQDEYGMLTKRLRESVSSLEEIVSGNMELEPARCRRSQVTWYRLLRDLSESIYQALQSSMMKCVCPGLHHFGLRLLSQPAILTPHDDEDEIAKSQKFNLVLSFNSTLAHDAWATAKLWNLLSLSVGTPKVAATGSRVRFSLPTPNSSEISDAGGISSSGFGDSVQLSQQNSQPISNLCHTIRRSRKQAARECCGRISDGSPKGRIYDVFPLGSPNDSDDWSPVSLGSVLAEDAAFAGLTCVERLRLAWIVTAGVLQLEGTPWLPRSLLKDEIFLTRSNGVLLTEDVFIMKRLPEASNPARLVLTNSCHNASLRAQTTIPNIKNPRDPETIKALGILLVEIIFGQTIDYLQAALSSHTTVFAPGGALSPYETVQCLMDQINMRVGANYCSAIKWCMNGVGFGDTAGNDVLIGVVSLLEQDLRHIMG
ncbi:hypothetical protein B0T16DRAFT_406417 [Cercophora newfieldiana]|uniref:DUF7580 domain-containing protein n=1 Tax=Cercophora newfieldiana TaxID=92897 RepID=A0AA39YJ83_9PEZI|nr:hypothetical protein B0T16DRAFT_406417 [Cercophora newfieldiana]